MFLSIKPKIIVFFITYKCNSRCIMCSAWQKQADSKEMSLEEIEKIFSNKLIKSELEIINLTGGEPTLRADLVDIIKILLKHCVNLKRIDIPTNGIDTFNVLEQIEKILALLLPTNIKLSVTVSLDGVKGIHEKVRQIPGIFNKVEETIMGLKELQALYSSLSLGLNTVISKLNYQNLREIKDYAAKNNLGINFTLAAISEIGVESIQMRDKFEMTQNERKEVIPFFKELLAKKEISQSYGKFVIGLFEYGKRNNGCAFRRGKAILLGPNGDAYACGNFKEFRLDDILDTRSQSRCLQNISRHILHGFPNRCLSCMSNCYIDEA